MPGTYPRLPMPGTYPPQALDDAWHLPLKRWEPGIDEELVRACPNRVPGIYRPRLPFSFTLSIRLKITLFGQAETISNSTTSLSYSLFMK